MSDDTITIREAKLLAYIAEHKPAGFRMVARELMEEHEWVRKTTHKLLDMGLIVKFDPNPTASKLIGAPLISSLKAAPPTTVTKD